MERNRMETCSVISRGMLFSVPMIKALLDGSKTQTRRVCKLQPIDNVRAIKFELLNDKEHAILYTDLGQVVMSVPHPVGSLIWCKETFCEIPLNNGRMGVAYKADGDEAFDKIKDGWDWMGKWRPSIFMPRCAARVSLEVVGVRVERLQDISEEDAKAEGAPWLLVPL